MRPSGRTESWFVSFWSDFSVLLVVLRASVPALVWQVASQIAAIETEAPCGCSFAAPDAYLHRSHQAAVVQLSQRARGGVLRALEFIGQFTRAQANHAVVDACVAVHELDKSASGREAQVV